ADGARPPPEDLEEPHLQPHVATDAAPAVLDALGQLDHARFPYAPRLPAIGPGQYVGPPPARRARAASQGGSTSATATAPRISAPPASAPALSGSPVSRASSAAKTGSSSRISAARDGLTIRWAQTIARKANAVANTPVKAAASSASRPMASPPP